MSKRRMQTIEKKRDGFFPIPDLGLSWNLQDVFYPPGGLFASVGQMGVGFGVSPNPPNPNPDPKDNGITDLYAKYVSPEFGFGVVGSPTDTAVEAAEQVLEEAKPRKKKKVGLKLKIRIGNPHFRRLFSGAIAGAVSRTAVAPLETIRTHLMVGSNGNSTTEVFHSIIRTEGWQGLFRGNFVNVIRVAPSKAIEFSVAGWVQCSLDFNDPMPHGVLEYAHAIHRSKASKAMLSCISMHDPRDHAALDHQTLFAYDTAKNILTPKMGEPPKLPVPSSLVAGAFAGVSSTLCTYPLELLKTRLTIQREAYDNLLHAFIKILREEGPAELYRGLTPSLIGVVPYAATNYFAYETLKKLYRKTFKEEEIGNFATLLIGSAAGAISSSTTFPLEVARKHMQVGAVGGRQVYKNMLHALVSILENEGIYGLYKGLGPSCMKLVPAAGISFMCYEACKKILIDKEDDA